MRRNLVCALGILLSSAGLSFSQAPTIPAEAPMPVALADEKAPPKDTPPPGAVKPNLAVPAPALTGDACCPKVDCCNTCEKCGPRFWASGEYLLWWIKAQPVSVPLLTANATGNNPIIGLPGTQVLFGNSDVGMGTFSGSRINAGYWLNNDRTIGIEGSGFLLEQRTKIFTAASDPTGNPFLGVPLIDVPSGANDFISASAPGFDRGSVIYANATRLWGAEANAVWSATRSDNWSVSLLGGFRYIDLAEKLSLTNPFISLTTGINNLYSDNFETQNHFYGGQLGARVSYQTGAWSAELSGKLALGVNHEAVNIAGDRRLISPTGQILASGVGGNITAASDIGRQTRDQFAVIPEVQVKVGYDVTRNVRATVGYDFLYWNQVVRPGDQIDPRFGILNGVTFPQPQFNRTDFYAHGVSFGLEFRF